MKLKTHSHFFYVGMAAFALLCILVSALSICLKIIFGLLALAIVVFDFYSAKKNSIQTFRYFATHPPYWVLTDSSGIHIAHLLPEYTYQSRYFVCLFWRHLMPSMKRRRNVLLCCWQYDMESWHALHRLLTIYPSNKKIA